MHQIIAAYDKDPLNVYLKEQLCIEDSIYSCIDSKSKVPLLETCYKCSYCVMKVQNSRAFLFSCFICIQTCAFLCATKSTVYTKTKSVATGDEC